MKTLSDILFVISNGLLIPVIILLLYLAMRAVWVLFCFYNEYKQKMKIAGIFTDGDLRRVFDMGVDVRQLGIADVMTPGGIRVRPGILAVEALNLMQSRHITSVLVADGDHLLGVLHMHDLLRAGVV